MLPPEGPKLMEEPETCQEVSSQLGGDHHATQTKKKLLQGSEGFPNKKPTQKPPRHIP